MKNSLIAKLTATAALVGAASAYAGVTPNLLDSTGAPVRDASGACVQTSGATHPNCAPRPPHLHLHRHQDPLQHRHQHRRLLLRPHRSLHRSQ